jgi:hypothetical protein
MNITHKSKLNLHNQNFVILVLTFIFLIVFNNGCFYESNTNNQLQLKINKLQDSIIKINQNLKKDSIEKIKLERKKDSLSQQQIITFNKTKLYGFLEKASLNFKNHNDDLAKKFVNMAKLEYNKKSINFIKKEDKKTIEELLYQMIKVINFEAKNVKDEMVKETASMLFYSSISDKEIKLIKVIKNTN